MLKIEKMPASINLGNQIENDTKIIQIDVSAWNALYPGCAYHITAMRPGDTGNWPVTGVSHADGVLTWVVPDTMTSVPGQGSLVIHCTLNGKNKNTGSCWYFIGPGHAAMGEAPDPVADWIEDATSKLAEVDHFIGETIEATESANTAAGLTQDAVDRANAISETMEGIAPKWAAVDIEVTPLAEGATPTASIEQGETGTSIAIGIPKGDTGAQGPVGNVMYATFDIDFDTGELVMTIPDGYTGPTFSINDETGELEVSI